MLTILEAEGIIFIFGDLVFLHPPYVAHIMKTLSNHFLDLDELVSAHFHNQMIEFVGNLPENQKGGFNDFETLKTRLEMFVLFGKISGEIDGQNVLLRFIWRHLEKLDQRHYAQVIDMFQDSGIIIDSTFDLSESGKRLTGKHPIVVFRLPSDKPSDAVNHWPPTYPEEHTHFELRIQLPAGCPESLAISFAAKCHAFGNCLHAWIHGATVVTEEKNDRIHAELMKPTNACEYILFAVRTSSVSDEYSKFLCSLAFTFMKEQEKYLPGLLYDVLWTCPECIKRINRGRQDKGITTFTWDPDEKKKANIKQLCRRCEVHVNLITMKMVVSPEDACTLAYHIHDEVSMREILAMLRNIAFQQHSISSRLDELPDVILNIHKIDHPYLFKFISETEFEEFCNALQEPNSNSSEDVIGKLDEAEKVLAKMQNGVDFISLPLRKQKQSILNYILFKLGYKKKRIYLQLLDGSTFLPIITYEVEISELTKKVKKIMEFGADLCTIGIKASIVWNASGTIASAFGIPVPSIDKEQLKKIQSFLVKVNDGDPSAGLMGMSSGSPTYSSDDIAKFGSYLEELENKSNVRHFRENFSKDDVKEKKWKDALRKAIVKSQSGRKQVTWIDKRNNIAGLGYEL